MNLKENARFYGEENVSRKYSTGKNRLLFKEMSET